MLGDMWFSGNMIVIIVGDESWAVCSVARGFKAGGDAGVEKWCRTRGGVPNVGMMPAVKNCAEHMVGSQM